MLDPSLFEIFSQGGALMFLPLLWLLVFVVAAAFFFTGRLGKSRSVLFIFPLGFGLLALTQFFLQRHFSFGDIATNGSVDPLEYAIDALVAIRSALMICAAAGLSFVVAIIAFWFPRELGKGQKQIR